MLKGKINIDDYEIGEIINQPQGVVIQGKNMKEGKNKHFFHIDDRERYLNQNLSSVLLCINKRKKNSNEDRAEITKIFVWYMEIIRALLHVIKMLPIV